MGFLFFATLPGAGGTNRSPFPLVMARCSWSSGCTSGVTNPASALEPVASVVLLLLYPQQLGNPTMGRGLLLWLLGIPIPVIILLYVFHVI